MEAFGLSLLSTQSSLAGSLGVQTATPEGTRLEVTGFANKMRVTDIRSTEQLTSVLRENCFEMRNGRSCGAELMLERLASYPLSGWLAYTLSWSQREVDHRYGPSDWDQRHVIDLVLNQRLGRGWMVGSRFHHHTGRIQTITDCYSGTAAQRVRLPPFYQLDIRAEKKWTLDQFFLSAYAEFANLTMTRKVFGYALKSASSRSEAQAQSLRILQPSLEAV